jgi:hypothetical protein
MRRGVFAGILLCLCLASAALAATESAKKGTIGGAPTLKLGAPDEGKRATPDLVIGRGRTYDGHAEIVAYGWKPPGGEATGNKHFCVWIEYPPGDIEFGVCAESGQPNSPIEISSEQQQISPSSARYTEVGGLVSPEVATVGVTYTRNGKTKHAKVNLAKVRPKLQAKLGLTDGFGYWDTKAKGLVPLKSYKARAFDAKGKLLDTATHLSGTTTFAR